MSEGVVKTGCKGWIGWIGSGFPFDFDVVFECVFFKDTFLVASGTKTCVLEGVTSGAGAIQAASEVGSLTSDDGEEDVESSAEADDDESTSGSASESSSFLVPMTLLVRSGLGVFAFVLLESLIETGAGAEEDEG